MDPSRSRRSLPWWVRWLHTYLSMLGFVSLLFFAITGITLNHADAFEAGGTSVQEAEGLVALDMVQDEVDDLGIVEHLRREHQVTGAVHEFLTDEYECTVIFKGPGYAADALIDRETGTYSIVQTMKGAMALLNDLHKGRDSGAGWSWFIDISAGVIGIAALTGLWLLCYVRKRRTLGLWLTLIGTAIPIAVFCIAVP